MSTTIVMTSNRPYLLRAMYEWIADNGMTPYILVDAGAAGVNVPKSAIKDGRIVLNIAARAVAQLELGKESVSFMARFAGVSQSVEVPMGAILAIYAQENGQGMMFPAEGQTPPPQPDSAAKKGPHLRVVK
jgi:stringent starvation protein B